jgi:hypothetical protein
MAGRDHPPDVSKVAQNSKAMAAGEATRSDDACEEGEAHQRSKGAKVVHAGLVSGMGFYGYQEHPSVFVRISLACPTALTRAATLLLHGAVMGMPIQPYEAHIPFLLQARMTKTHGVAPWSMHAILAIGWCSSRSITTSSDSDS